MDGWNTTFKLGRPIFRRRTVRFREGIYLEDHPGTDVSNDHPLFISHEIRPFGRGPTAPGIGDENDHHGPIKHLQVMGFFPPSNHHRSHEKP